MRNHMQNREPIVFEEAPKDFYVYIHLRKDGTPFYVGKGHGKRAYELSVKRRSTMWVRTAVKEYGDTGNVTVVLLYTNLDESTAHELEILTIKEYGRKNNNTGILVNLTDGGDGVSGIIRSDEYRKNISIRMSKEKHPYYGKVGPRAGIPHSEKTKQLLREVNLGSNNPNFGKERTLQSKIKSRNSNITEPHHVLRKNFCDNIAISKTGGKVYTICSPNGEEFTFTNQRKFAHEHNLSQQSLSRLLKGERKSYLGWTVKDINISENKHAKS